MAFGMGWVPDRPDARDFTDDSSSVEDLLKKAGVANPSKVKMAPSIDLRAWCSPIEDQESLGSCTANAGCGLVEFFERRAFGVHIDASRLFLYKVTRNLLGWVGDTGAYLRDTIKALALFGVPPERYWRYDITNFEMEPTGFCYAFAQNYQALEYYRLDPTGATPEEVLKRVKANLMATMPSIFGFTVYSSYVQAGRSGEIPYPSVSGESAVGGHAVMAVGYDDAKTITNLSDGSTTKGALLIRNSWGDGWGDQGYGWLPYEYVLKGDAIDWWSLIKAKWIDTGNFKA